MPEVAARKTYATSSIAEKIVYVGKLILFICSFGFMFPVLLDDPDYDAKAKRHLDTAPKA